MRFSTALFAVGAIIGADGFVAQRPSPITSALKASTEKEASVNVGKNSDVLKYAEALESAIANGSGDVLQYAGALEKASNNFAGALQRKSAPAAAPKGASAGLKGAHDQSLNAVNVQGDSLKTWSFTTNAVERVQVIMKTEGRPLTATVELWQGPDNTPQKMNIYSEDGCVRPFNAVVETPRGASAIAIRNTGHLEFPCTAAVEAELEGTATPSAGLGVVTRRLTAMGSKKVIQGGALNTYPFSSKVSSVQVLLKTDGRPLNARIELMQGPNNNKQVMEIYTEDGSARPFFAIIETPGSGNVVRVINTGTIEFPLSAYVEPFMVDAARDEGANGRVFQIS